MADGFKLILPSFPECTLTYRNLTMSDLLLAHELNEYITGIVRIINPVSQLFYVQLGEDIWGLLPFENASIQKMEYVWDNNENPCLSAYPKSLINRKIRIQIVSIVDDTITLTRIPCMKESLKMLRNFKENWKRCLFIGEILSKSATHFFVDFCDGLIGCIPLSEPEDSLKQFSDCAPISIPRPKVGSKIICMLVNAPYLKRFDLRYGGPCRDNLEHALDFFSLNPYELIDLSIPATPNFDKLEYISKNTVLALNIHSQNLTKRNTYSAVSRIGTHIVLHSNQQHTANDTVIALVTDINLDGVTPKINTIEIFQ